MKNQYKPMEAKIKKIIKETDDMKTYWIAFTDRRDRENFWFEAGQFVQIGVLGFGEAPISLSSSPHLEAHFEITVRACGKVTNQLAEMEEGDKVFVRGPFGKGWPKPQLDDHLILVAGGIGLPAVKPLLDDFCHGYLHVKSLQTFYGTTHFDKLVCMRYFDLWRKEAKLHVTLDQKDPRWKESVGLITEIIKKAKINKDSKVFIIGPPIMYKFVIAEMKKKGIEDKNIFVSLERRMHCGVGVCQHCACGDKFACTDGPVFRYDRIKDIPDVL
ncbi:MAG: FAD/NAD(P)-binding protein [Patescibacteria group bacterium]